MASTVKYMEYKEFNPFDFQTMETLGHGNYGTVYKTYDKRRQTTVVIKQINTTQVEERDILAEVTALNAVESICRKNILCKLDFAYTSPYFYIVTEYLGEYLTLDQCYNIPDQRWISISFRLIEGLVDLHRIGIAHRDIKPENLMVHRTGTQIKYIDFGFSCYQAHCEDQRVVGTPLYIAPEIIISIFPRNMNQWLCADIWSLGVVLLELCLNMYQPPMISFIEFLARKDGYDISEGYTSLPPLARQLYDTGLDNRLLEIVCTSFPMSERRKRFIKHCLQPMLQGRPMERKIVCVPNSTSLSK